MAYNLRSNTFKRKKKIKDNYDSNNDSDDHNNDINKKNYCNDDISDEIISHICFSEKKKPRLTIQNIQNNKDDGNYSDTYNKLFKKSPLLQSVSPSSSSSSPSPISSIISTPVSSSPILSPSPSPSPPPSRKKRKVMKEENIIKKDMKLNINDLLNNLVSVSNNILNKKIDDLGLDETNKNELIKIKNYIKDIEPDIKKILDLNLSFNKKSFLIDKIELYNNINDPLCKFDLKYDIQDFIKHNNSDINIEKVKEKKEEIKKIKNNNDLKSKILLSNLSNDIKKIVYDKYKYFKTLKSNQEEYPKTKLWIETVLKIPIISKKINIYNLDLEHSQQLAYSYELEHSQQLNNELINNFLTNLRLKLDKKLYGMDNVKNELIINMFNRINNIESKNHFLTLVGSPGVGKTSIINVLSEYSGLPFKKIPMGGCNNVSVLKGNDSVYVNSGPGLLLTMLINMKYNNGIIFLDEIDKLSTNEFSNSYEINMFLLHILDYQQNNKYYDDFLTDIPIDLSKIWFILAANNENDIHPILRDRLKIIKIPSYNTNNKIEIVKKYIIPDTLNKYNLTNNITFDEDAIKYIININNNNDNKSGIRGLQVIIDHIINRIKIYSHVILNDNSIGNLNLGFNLKNFSLPYNINIDTINKIYKLSNDNEEWKLIYM
jgi:ATP-dependent Lon protease